MQLSPARGFLRKLSVALTVVSVAVPLFAMPADASSADQLTVRINSPKDGDTVSGFVNVNHTVNPRGQLGQPMRPSSNPYRARGLDYAAGKVDCSSSGMQTYRLSSWTFSPINASGLAKANRHVFVAPGYSSARPPRVSTYPWDSTTVPDGPATLRIRGYGYDGSTKDACIVVNVQNKGSKPDYTEMIAPKNGETVGFAGSNKDAWVPVTFTAMPERLGIARGIKDQPYTNFLPSCLDFDINYWKVAYATGASPDESEFRDWAYSDYNYQITRNTAAPGVVEKNAHSTISPAGCSGSPVFTNKGGVNWDSTTVPDGPATIRVTIVYNDGTYIRFDRVVNVANNEQGAQYFGLDKAALAKPLSGDNAGIPGWADVPSQGIPKFSDQLPTAFYACDIAAGSDVAPNGGAWTMFWISDNTVKDRVRNEQGLDIDGTFLAPDFTPYRSQGRSGALCRLDTTTVPNGAYTIRLRQQLTDGTTQVDTADITIQNS